MTALQPAPAASAAPAPSMAQPDLSVIIVNWNTRVLLAGCLDSLPDASATAAVECIVVDNGSTDGSVAYVRTTHPEVRLIEAGENLGFARANNRALSQARGRYLLLLNSDTVVHPGALDALVRVADALPQAGIAGCRLLNSDGSLQESWAAFPSLRSELRGKLDRQRTRLAARPELGPVYAVDWVGGAAFLVRRELYEQIGGLDERFFMYSEETDYCYRARQAGWLVVYAEDAVVTHLGGGSESRASAKQLISLYDSKIYFFRKHHGKTVALLLRTGVVAGQMIRLAASFIPPGARAQNRAARVQLLRHLVAGYANRN